MSYLETVLYCATIPETWIVGIVTFFAITLYYRIVDGKVN